MAKLLETALTVNPDYICVAEMKSDEAFYAQESARSGHGVPFNAQLLKRL
jgi:pilus assembly protein CpaF